MEKKDKDKIRKNKVRLVEELDVGNDLLSILVKDHTLTDEMVERITVHPVKHYARTSELLSLLPKRGPKAFGIFIQALVETSQADLAKMLDPVLTADLQKSKHQQETATMHSQETREAGDVGPVDKNVAEKLLKLGDVYDMNTNPRGRAVIINNENFDDDRRVGTDVDESKLKQLFKSLYFEVFTHKDLTANKIRETLDQERQNQKSSANAFVLCILSHGQKNRITGTDRSPIFIDEITSMFDGTSCKTLMGKPKIFIFQSCQGNNTCGVSTDEPDFSITNQFENMSVVDVPDARPIPTEQVHQKRDIVVAYSTVPDFVSWRHPSKGSWFINDLVDTFDEHACNDDILHLLTKVGNKMSNRQTSRGLLQASETVHSLTKKLYFFPGYAVKQKP